MSLSEQGGQLPREIPNVKTVGIGTPAEVDPEPPVIVPDAFVVDDASKASWVVRKIVEAREYAQRVQRWWEQELRRVVREETWLLQRFGDELEAWTKAELERRGGRKGFVHLPGGMVGFRHQPARLQIVDEQAAIAWCRAHFPLALKVMVEANDERGSALLRWYEEHAPGCHMRQQVLRDPLSDRLMETGELPDGINMRPAADQFYIR